MKLTEHHLANPREFQGLVLTYLDMKSLQCPLWCRGFSLKVAIALFGVIPTLTKYSGTVSDISPGMVFGNIWHMYISLYIIYTFWHSFWHKPWHSIWHSIWYILRHFIWHSFWHFIWHIFWRFIWHSFWHSIWHIYIIYKQTILYIYIRIFLHFIWPSFWHWHTFNLTFYLAFPLAFYLTYILTFGLAFFLASSLTFFLPCVRVRAYPDWSSLNWNWSENSPLDNELALDVRSGSVGAHNCVELAEGGGRGEGRREAGISPDPHLAGGE